MKKKYLLVTLLAVLQVTMAFAPAYPEAGNDLKKAAKAYASQEYELALELYRKVLQKNPDHLQANLRAGICYLDLLQPAKAFEHLEFAYKKDPKVTDEILMLLGEAQQQLYNFEEAMGYFRTELASLSRAESWNKEFLLKRLRECESGLALSANPVLAQITNLGPAINSPYSDYVPVMLPGDTLLLYTTRRPVSEARGRTGVVEYMHVSKLRNGAWQQAELFLQDAAKLPDHSAVSVAPNGQELYTYFGGKNRGLFMSEKAGQGWSDPVRLGSPFNEGTVETSMHVTDDGKFAFFSSDRPGGFGGLDLYICYKQENGTWSDALNLGPAINSAYDEDAPFVDVKTNTLYFSSRGHNAIGGYDVFKSSIKDSVWSQAQNLGMPVNSPFDDIYFSLTHNRDKAIFSSDRPGGHGRKDVYFITFK
ncbi:tetratricopeptide repeat protein [Pontibacter qinzhouensis]|uniref:Tetratricopeptide repeat protein n=1 Tax=Pontibacter qinzhouensis TaxID=2603253 RepID=A0A5C8K9I8_9BACT|nr:tetratricopeptide repeat protein [Pontibacter qinzhouensis]TXK48043.1 tetratricopeptide repeat protein [Pontibacter qinzhouensis]